MDVDQFNRNTEQLNRIVNRAIYGTPEPMLFNPNIGLINADYHNRVSAFRPPPVNVAAGMPRTQFPNNLILTINPESGADGNEPESNIIDHNVPPNPTVGNIIKVTPPQNAEANGNNVANKDNSITKDKGNTSEINEGAGTSGRNNLTNNTIEDGSDADNNPNDSNTPSTNHKGSAGKSKADKKEVASRANNTKTKDKSKSSSVNKDAGRSRCKDNSFVSIKDGSDMDDDSSSDDDDNCNIINTDNSSSNNDNIKSKQPVTVNRDSVIKSDNNDKTKSKSKSLVVNKDDGKTKGVYTDNSLFVTIKDCSDTDNDSAIVENDDNIKTNSKSDKTDNAESNIGQSSVVNEGAGTSQENSEEPNAGNANTATTERSDFNGDVTPTIIRFVRNNNILCENVVRDEDNEAERERRRPTLSRPVLLCPPESLDRIPQNNILYVNVSRRLSNTYRLTIPSDVFNSQSLRAICHMPGSLDSSNYVTDYTVYRFGRSDNDPHANYIQIGPNNRNNNNAVGMRPNHSNLQVLSLTGYRNITDRSLVHLSTAAPELRLLDLSGSRVTRAGVEKFKTMKPECEVVWSEGNEE